MPLLDALRIINFCRLASVLLCGWSPCYELSVSLCLKVATSQFDGIWGSLNAWIVLLGRMLASFMPKTRVLTAHCQGSFVFSSQVWKILALLACSNTLHCLLLEPIVIQNCALLPLRSASWVVGNAALDDCGEEVFGGNRGCLLAAAWDVANFHDQQSLRYICALSLPQMMETADGLEVHRDSSPLWISVASETQCLSLAPPMLPLCGRSAFGERPVSAS
jgi:hypothetical protein